MCHFAFFIFVKYCHKISDIKARLASDKLFLNHEGVRVENFEKNLSSFCEMISHENEYEDKEFFVVLLSKLKDKPVKVTIQILE